MKQEKAYRVEKQVCGTWWFVGDYDSMNIVAKVCFDEGRKQMAQAVRVIALNAGEKLSVNEIDVTYKEGFENGYIAAQSEAVAAGLEV